MDGFIRRVSEKASARTLQILLISCALIGMVLIFSGLKIFGYVLSYLVCAGVLVYPALYVYYRTRGIE